MRNSRYLLAALAVLGLAAASWAKPVEVQFQLGWAVDSARGKAIQPIVDAFNKKYEGKYLVKMITGDKIDSARLLTQVASGAAPDIMQMNITTLRAFAAQDLLDPIVGFDSFLSKVYPSVVLDKVTHRGDLYGIPWIGHTIQLVYNADLLKKAGIAKAPSTWDELLATAKQIKAKTGVDGLAIAASQHYDTVWMSMPILFAYGAPIFKGVPGSGTETISLSDPKSLAAMAKLQEFYGLYAAASTANGGKVMEDFRAQKAAMEFQGPWGVTDVWKNGRPFAVKASLMPAGPAGRFADVGVEALVVPAGNNDSGKRKAIQAFLDYMLTPEAQMAVLVGEYNEPDKKYYPFRVPIRNDLSGGDFFKQYPELVPFVDGFQYVCDTAPTPYWSQLGSEVWSPVMNELSLKKITPAQAAKKIEDGGNAIIKAFYKK